MVETCEKYRMELSALLDEQLDKQLKSEVEEHLSGCTDCSQEMETLKSLCQLIGREMEPDNVEMPDLWAKMKDQVPTVCQVMDEDLSAYLDGELPAPAQEGVNAHLKECPDCLAKFKTLNSTNQFISKGLELPADISVDLWPAVKSRLNEDCALIHTELSPYIDQEVATLRHRAITTHLVDCQGCRDEFNRLSSVGEAIREHYKPDIPEDFDLWPGIKSQLQVVQFTPRSANQPQQQKAKPGMRRAYWMSAAAAVVLGIIGFGSFWLMSPGTSSIKTVSAEDYLIESALTEPAGSAEAVLYEY
ncbi:MAG: zf-HC2 domain-containing protein [Candidatus Melainabacteria bacterium]|nr:zf-HC2 domain-containing protein [Candidatus Melainabacteria bacterium]